jgi:outer membrane biosynthesis protein TonB
MSIVIALIVVLVVGGIIANLYPKSNKSTLAKGEILTPESEVLPEPIHEVIIEPLVVPTPETKVEAPKMTAKPKKKPQPKKKPVKAKINA